MTPAAMTQAAETTHPAETTRSTGTPRSATEAALIHRLETIPAGRRLAITLPAPLVEPEALFDAAPLAGPGVPELEVENHGLVWRPPSGASFSGLGASIRLDLHGEGRFTDLRHRSEGLFTRLDSEALDGAESPTPRAFGGFAFDVGAADAPPWNAFGDGCFTLPRWLYRRRDHSADLTLTLSAEDLQSRAPQQWAALTLRLVDALHTAKSPALRPAELPRLVEDTAADNAWVALVDDIRQAIRRGEVEKIVAARRFTAMLGADRSLARVIERLGQRRRSTAFAFARPGATFLGLTPERLITKTGLHFRTEALAGSIESGAEHAAELLGSGKDRLEQQLVVDAILRRLEPLAAHLEASKRPSVRELPEVLHLHTPIRGQLKTRRHVLELAELLHPTPAVGGVPTPDAMTWIRERENDARGWYASPVGWFDADGDGELVVALRSCLLLGHRAELFAGAGIVGDSDSRRELAEVRLKLQTLMHALAS